MAVHTYRQIKPKNRKKFKEELEHSKELNNKIINKLMLLWIKPGKDRNKLIDDVLKNKITVEDFWNREKQIAKYIQKCNKLFKEGQVTMPFKITKVKRQIQCRKCKKEIKVRKHMILCASNLFCLNCGEQYLNDHREQYKKRIADINKALRNLRRYHKERVLLKLE